MSSVQNTAQNPMTGQSRPEQLCSLNCIMWQCSVCTYFVWMGKSCCACLSMLCKAVSNTICVCSKSYTRRSTDPTSGYELFMYASHIHHVSSPHIHARTQAIYTAAMRLPTRTPFLIQIMPSSKFRGTWYTRELRMRNCERTMVFSAAKWRGCTKEVRDLWSHDPCQSAEIKSDVQRMPSPGKWA